MNCKETAKLSQFPIEVLSFPLYLSSIANAPSCFDCESIDLSAWITAQEKATQALLPPFSFCINSMLIAILKPSSRLFAMSTTYIGEEMGILRSYTHLYNIYPLHESCQPMMVSILIVKRFIDIPSFALTVRKKDCHKTKSLECWGYWPFQSLALYWYPLGTRFFPQLLGSTMSSMVFYGFTPCQEIPLFFPVAHLSPEDVGSTSPPSHTCMSPSFLSCCQFSPQIAYCILGLPWRCLASS